LAALTCWIKIPKPLRSRVLHLDKRAATPDVDVVSRYPAVRGLVPVVGELDEAGLAGDVVGELVHEVQVVLTLLKWWSFERVVVITYDCCTLTLLVLRLRVLGLDEEGVRRVGWAGPSSSF
jgi:hypothetical protein